MFDIFNLFYLFLVLITSSNHAMNNQHLKADYCSVKSLFADLCGKLGQYLIKKADLNSRFAKLSNQILLL